MFRPKFEISSSLVQALMRIEAAKEAVSLLPMNPKIQASLRQSARLLSTHYSTQIEGNKLTLGEAKRVIDKEEHFPGRERDEKEVLGYYRALDALEKISSKKKPVGETTFKLLHGYLMGGGKNSPKPTPYRDGQNVIKDSRTGRIVYLPPAAKDVPSLMKDLVSWLVDSEKSLPCPLRAGILHYQIATIHPYYDGNGRLARLSTTLLLHLGGYDLKGFYSLEEYYARDLLSYYRAISVGPSHNYYEGRREADISGWLEYFSLGMAEAFENVRKQAEKASVDNPSDMSEKLRELAPRQRRVLDLFQKSTVITASQVAKLFGLSHRTARVLCQKWVQTGFLTVSDPAKKSRKYSLSKSLDPLLK